MTYWVTLGAFLLGAVLGAFVTFVFFAEQLGPWIKWKESVIQRELAIAEALQEREKAKGTLVEDGHKRSEYRSEL